MVKIVCKHSGLEFEAPSRRTKVHPQISYYTAHKDSEYRYLALSVICRGKTEKWDKVDRFKEEIQKEWEKSQEPPERPDYDFECSWAAIITGSHEKFRFSRSFLESVDSEGRNNRYLLPVEGSILEICHVSRRGNQRRHYFKVTGGDRVDITIEEVEQLFPKIEKEPEPDYSHCLKINKLLGNKGDAAEHNGVIYRIVETGADEYWDDHDGIIWKNEAPPNGFMARWVERWCYVEPASEEESKQFRQEQEIKVCEKSI